MASEPCPGTQPQTTVVRRRDPRMMARVRAIIAVALIVLWGVSALTGFLLYIAPAGPRSGRLVMFFLTKREWGDVHFWVSVLAGIVTVIHVVIDWKALKACVRFLVSTERGQKPGM